MRLSVSWNLELLLHQVNTIGFTSTGEKGATLSDEAYEYIVLQYNQQIHRLWDLKEDIQTQLLSKLEQKLPSLPSPTQCQATAQAKHPRLCDHTPPACDRTPET
ncbi:MAG: hypothetical protein AAGE59_33395 [Cyanobacteria bacterium P01_F01_bin.86]